MAKSTFVRKDLFQHTPKQFCNKTAFIIMADILHYLYRVLTENDNKNNKTIKLVVTALLSK